MATWLIIIVALIYAWISVDFVIRGNYAQAIVFSGYAFSNIGLYWLAKVTEKT